MLCICILFFLLFSAIYSKILVIQWVKITSRQPKTTFRLRQERLGFLFSLQILQILQITDTRSALSQSQKARRVAVTVIRSCEATREARSGTPFETHLLQKGALRIIVTDVFCCKTTRTARGGARKMSVYSSILLSCLALDEAMIIN